MFQYEYEKRPPSSTSCESRATMTTDWSRVYPTAGTSGTSGASGVSGNTAARRPLPPRPIVCDRIPAKPTVPLKVWIVASASCFAVCAALVLATVVLTRWGAGQTYTAELFDNPEPVYSNHPKYTQKETPTKQSSTEYTEQTDDIQLPILEKLPIFKNAIVIRDRKANLASKPQIHPIHESIEHEERRIEKKHEAKLPLEDNTIPDFKPTLPDIFINKHKNIRLSDGYVAGLRKQDDYNDYYNDENLYDDYIQSNTMISYLIEKVQELHNWLTSDPDFVVNNKNGTKKASDQFGQVLKALNESILEGNVSIVLAKLRDIYFGDNYTVSNNSGKVILNTTDLLSFGILSLDVMLLHNIQLMAWENQEATRLKMLKDPNVFAFNALFMDPSKIEGIQNEISASTQRYDTDDGALTINTGASVLDNILEIGASSARAAIHLGRAYRNTKLALSHAAHAPQRPLRDSRRVYTELDCVWLVYCRNLIASSKLPAPYSTMAKINGVALRVLWGELPLAGAAALPCDRMFPRCSKVNAAGVVLDAITQPLRKAQVNRAR
ncbi:uncharacterized protein LOC128682285 isoform X2 [Plodia interpunctella]|uniref:uncharacterized protein LOC128682285 isoform X2 n=1 Tax=Plodia interpunctella TaxID=58824 RepID=UPI0023685DE8|nr:uncharacterized protein LOC128682285 isoform X2 [Plodia interpunctella]